MPKKHPLSEQDAFLVPVPISKPTSRGFHLHSTDLCFCCEELEILRSGNKETLAPDLTKKPPIQTGGFFVSFLEWSDDLSISTSCFWFTAFEYSSDFDFRSVTSYLEIMKTIFDSEQMLMLISFGFD